MWARDLRSQCSTHGMPYLLDALLCTSAFTHEPLVALCRSLLLWLDGGRHVPTRLIYQLNIHHQGWLAHQLHSTVTPRHATPHLAHLRVSFIAYICFMSLLPLPPPPPLAMNPSHHSLKTHHLLPVHPSLALLSTTNLSMSMQSSTIASSNVALLACTLRRFIASFRSKRYLLTYFVSHF